MPHKYLNKLHKINLIFFLIPGKYNPFQLLVLALVESALFVVNAHIGYSILGVLDIGGAIFIHAFGAFFGLAAREGGIRVNLDSNET